MKKGQVTVFIIIGIILLTATALYLFTRQEMQHFTPAEVHPEKRNPIQQYVDSCVVKIGEDAVKELAFRGGYIRMPETMRYDPSASINLFPGSMDAGILVPLWQHNGEIRVPSINMLQYDLEYYMENNIGNCLHGLEPFIEEYNIEFGEPTADVVIAEDDVVFNLDMDIKLSSKVTSEVLEYHNFYGVVDARLKKAWTLAKELLESANKRGFLEQFLMDVMTLNPDVPWNGMEFQCSRLQWDEKKVSDSVKTSIAQRLPLVRFQNTDYLPFMYDKEEYEKWRGFTLEDIFIDNKLPSGSPPEDMWEYTHMFLNFTDEDFTDLGVNAYYDPTWSWFFNARPSDGQIMRSAQQKVSNDFLSSFCIQLYHFTYDVEFPIMITIYDKDSFGGDGFEFRFGLPVILVSNKPARDATPMNIYDKTASTEQFCGEMTPDLYYFKAKNKFGLADYLDGVNISYRCFNYECNLGMTDSFGTELFLQSAVPTSCANGMIIAEKEGYTTEQVQFSQSELTEIELYPTITLNYSVFKYEIPTEMGDDWNAEELDSNDFAVLQINHNNSEFQQVITYPIAEDMPQQIKLLFGPATYEVNFLLFHNDQPTGGYVGNLTTTWDELNGKTDVTFKLALWEPTPDNSDEQIEMFNFLYNNATYKEILAPEFS